METMKIFDNDANGFAVCNTDRDPQMDRQPAHSLVNTAQQEKEIVSNTYSALVDTRSKTVNEKGLKLCALLKIAPESILPKKLESFVEENEDAEIAKLRHKHHTKTRQKNLLRLGQRLYAVNNSSPRQQQ